MKKIFFSILVLSAFVLPAFAGEKEAYSEIDDTLHGVVAKKMENQVLSVDVINIGSDFSYLAKVTCQLLVKHGVMGTKRVDFYDKDDKSKTMATYDCTELDKVDKDTKEK